MKNGKTGKVCKIGSAALAAVNGLLLLDLCRQVHQLGLRSDAGPAAWAAQGARALQFLLTMPSLVIVVLLVALLALLIGKECIRPPVVPFGMNVLWLATSGLLVYRLAALAT